MAKEFVLDVYGQWSLKIWLLTHSGCKVSQPIVIRCIGSLTSSERT